MSIYQLDLSDAEFIAHELAKELMSFDEPLPEFSTRYPGKLESCLAMPFQNGLDSSIKAMYYNQALADCKAVIEAEIGEKGERK